jgi:hypothetical protein
MLRRTLAYLLPTALLVATGCNLIFGIEAGEPRDATGSTSGSGGSEPNCSPVVPATCDPDLLDDAENCCVTGRSCRGGACVKGVCEATLVTPSEPNEEALDVIVVGPMIAWTSGNGRKVYTTSIDGGTPTILSWAEALGFAYVTSLATDGQHVYFTDYGGPKIGRVPLEGGETEVMAEAPGSPSALFGRIAAGGGWVCWATEIPGNVWCARTTDPTPATPLLIATAAVIGVAMDATHVYWGDNTAGAIQRRALADLDAQGPPETVVSGQPMGIGELALDQDRVYWILWGSVLSARKEGLNQGLLQLVTQELEPTSLTADGVSVYWSTRTDPGAVRKVPRLGGAAETIATTVGAQGITDDCDTVYWVETLSHQVRKVTK